jgi:hypothetical protein
LLTDRKRLLSRDATGNGYLYAATLRKNLRFRASFDQVTAVSKRDALQHPYLEALHSWGMSVQHYQFGTDLGRTLLAIFRKGPPPPGHTSPDPATPLTVFKKALDKSPEQYKRLLRADLDAVGYPNSDVGLASLESVVIEGPPPTALFVKETDLPVPTLQTEMSQGMFRVVAILAQVNAAIVTNTPQVVLIDDIGEGLDFERSTNLIRLLVRKAEEHSFQLTMTTNDRFVMNAVPLDYWSILSRSGGIVRVFNQRNARKRFLEFKRLGLNNFDFFTNNYFLAAQKDEKARRVR